ncbi:TonB-dependent receptor domain-containing protein [Brevundimonas sp.]|uniref:TonB-dependent receptor domain-containing protein n=1 Tax=Brevundimonas sp. TaxID=1871086 RepID=UPI003BAD8D2B
MPLEQALRRVAAVAGRQVVFAPSAIAGLNAPPLQGALGLDDAMAILLRGSGLRADTDGAVIVIRPFLGPASVAEPPRPTEPAFPTVLDEVVVTALKQPSLLQSTPASITVLQGKSLGVGGAGSFNDILRQTPGMQMIQNGTTLQRIVLRGVQGFGEATTGVYYDETPVTGPAGSAADPGASQPAIALFDIDRVEILRGPQGTLYGSGSMGGTLRVLLNKPDPTRVQGLIESELSAIEGGDASRSIRGMVNLPLHHRVAVRLAAYDETKGGFIDNIRFGRSNINGSSVRGGRVAATFEATPDLRLAVTAIRQTTDYDDAISYWTPSLGAYQTDASIIGEHSEDLALYNVTATWDLPFATLTATASRYTWDRVTASDYTRTLASGVTDATGCQSYLSLTQACDPGQMQAFQAYALSRLPGAWRQISHLTSSSEELRLSSHTAATYRWTVGAYYERRHDDFGSFVYRADPRTGQVLAIPGDETGYRVIDNAIRQRAAFAEASWLPVPALTLTAGWRRYDYDTSVGGRVVVPNFLTGSSATDYRHSSTDARGDVGKVSASYRLGSATLIYAAAAEGFRPGGVNNVPGAGEALPAVYLPDSLISYEAGVKSGWFGHRLTAAAAAFRIDWTDMQISATSANGAWRYLTNAGAARIRGGELELRAQPLQGLTMTAAVSILDARLVRDQSSALAHPTAATGMAGDRIPFTPRYTLAASASYLWPLRPGLQGEARLNWFRTGASASEFRPTYETYEIQPAYDQLDARLALMSGRMTIAASVQNALNAVSPVRIISGVNGSRDQTTSLPPRTIAVSLSRSF